MHKSLIDAAPTLQPFDQLDLPPLPETTSVTSPGKRRRKIPGSRKQTLWPSWMRQHRALLATGAALVAFLIVSIAWFPSLAGWFRSGGGNQREPVEQVGVNGWIDLLPPIDLDREAVSGSWRKVGSVLTVDATSNARLTLPYQPPREYDFEVVFTRRSGGDSIALHFVHGSGQASFEIDAWMRHLAGIQNIGGLTLEDNPSRVVNQQLQNGRTYTALISVRRGGVEAYLDGNLLTTYEGDGAGSQLA